MIHCNSHGRLSTATRGTVNMDMVEVVTNLVQNVGFPIAICIYMMYNNNRQTKSWQEALQHNTDAITKLHSTFTNEMEG